MMRIFFISLSIMMVSFCSFAQSKNDSTSETEVILHTATGNIYGSLLIPATSYKIPVALIIAGSGPTDRDGNNPFAMNAGLKILADSLALYNIASFRYDKRGIKASQKAMKGEADLRFDDYVQDAAGWIELLKKDKRFSKVVVIGHSEGSLIGMIAAEKADMFISIAGAGRAADVILKEQLSQQPQAVQDMAFPVIDSLKKGITIDADPQLASLFRASVQPYLVSWFKYDPKAQISKLKIPVLLIQGTNDIQVTVEDAKQLAAGLPSAKMVLVENMNHVFRIVQGDRAANLATYSNSKLPVADLLINSIVDFINR